MDLFITLMFLSLVIVPIFLDEFFVKHGYFWTGSMLGLVVFYWECVGTDFFRRGAAIGNYATDMMDFAYIFPWSMFVIVVLTKLFWVRQFKQTGSVDRRYHFRYLFAPIGVAVIFAKFAIASVIDNEGIGRLLFLIDYIGFLPLLKTYLSYLFLPAALLTAWIVFRVERGRMPVERAGELAGTLRTNKVWVGIAIFCTIIISIQSVTELNGDIDQYLKQVQESIRLLIPGQPGFRSIHSAHLANDLVIFTGENNNLTTHCNCIYAVDRETKNIVWSTEALGEEILPLERDEYSINDPQPDFQIRALSADKTIVFMQTAHELFALNSQTGTILWRNSTLPETDVHFTEQSIFFENVRGDLIKAHASTGDVEWSLDLSTFTWDIDYFGEEYLMLDLYLPEDQKKEVMIDISTGKIAWEYSYLEDYSASAFADNHVAIISYRDEGEHPQLTVVNVDSDLMEWSYDLVQEPQTSSNLYLGEEYLYLVQELYDYRNSTVSVLCFDLNSGELLWKSNPLKLTGRVGTDLLEHYIYISSYTEKDHMLMDVSTGETIPIPDRTEVPTHYLTEKDWVIPIYSGKMKAVDVTSQEVVWQSEINLSGDYFEDDVRTSTPQDANQQVWYLAPGGGRVYSIDPITGEILWQWDDGPVTPGIYSNLYYMDEVTDDYLALYNAGGHDHVYLLSKDGELLFEYE